MDKGIDPAFKERLKELLEDMLKSLDDVVEESLENYLASEEFDDRKIIERKPHRFNFDKEDIDFNI